MDEIAAVEGQFAHLLLGDHVAQRHALRLNQRRGRADFGDFGDLANDFFAFDSAAQIGLELRYGLARGTQIGVHRTSDRDTQIFGQHSLLTERDGAPVGMDIMATLEGENNLSQHLQSTLGVLVSRKVAGRLALYGEPLFVINSNPFEDVGADNNTLMVGLGARLRLRPSLYVVGEMTPRLAWFDPGKTQMSFGVEGRAGGHLFQVNFSNGFGTTLARSRAAPSTMTTGTSGSISRESFFDGCCEPGG